MVLLWVCWGGAATGVLAADGWAPNRPPPNQPADPVQRPVVYPWVSIRPGSRLHPGYAASNLLFAARRKGDQPAAVLRRVRIEVGDAAGWEGAGRETTNWFVAHLSDGEQTWPGVGVRLQGNTTRRAPSQRPSLTLKFNQGFPGRDFHGMTKVLLHNGIHNPSYLSEYVGYGVFRRAGLPTPRVEYALVTINGRPKGLYVLVEGVTRDYLKRQFGRGDGSLYEGELTDVAGRLDQDNGDRSQAGRDLAPLLAALRGPAVTNGLAELGKVLNVEQFARFMAAEVLVGHSDGYCLSANNYRLYHHADDERFVFLPHGLEALFANPYTRLMPEMTGWVARALLASPEGRRLYVQSLRWVLEQALRREDLVADFVAGSLAVQQALAEGEKVPRTWQSWEAESLLTRLQERPRVAAQEVTELEYRHGLRNRSH